MKTIIVRDELIIFPNFSNIMLFLESYCQTTEPLFTTERLFNFISALVRFLLSCPLCSQQNFESLFLQTNKTVDNNNKPEPFTMYHCQSLVKTNFTKVEPSDPLLVRYAHEQFLSKDYGTPNVDLYATVNFLQLHACTCSKAQ